MREKLVQLKQAELQKILELWAKKNEILDPGEHIIFSLRVEKQPTVVNDMSQRNFSEMTISEFFTEKRFRELGEVPDHLAMRAHNCIINMLWYKNTDWDPKQRTVAQFLEHFDGRNLSRTKNFGRKTRAAVVKLLDNCHLPHHFNE